MCLLDEVLEWDADRIRCRTGSHRAADHPLRAHGRLGAACGIEYAAQSMAIHAALCAGAASAAAGRSAAGRLASARAVTLHVARLDDLASDLLVTAQRQGEQSAVALYRFSLATLEEPVRLLIEGRATVVLRA